MNNKAITIITPCFNENKTVIAFLQELEKVTVTLPYLFKIVVVDDSSSDNTLEMLNAYKVNAPNTELVIITLNYNQGHQGAIYQGLKYCENLPCDKFIVMDSDGEDDPRAIKELVMIQDCDVVNVVRGRRKENLTFRLSYYIYRMIFKLITGRIMNFGNYCMINKKVLIASTYTSFIHFAAHLSKQRVVSKQIIWDRLKRIDGKSKMNMKSLIYHAFKSFIEYAEDLLMVFLKLFLLLAIMFVGLIFYVIYQKLFTDKAIAGWASTLSVGFFNTAIICLGFFVTGILLLNLTSRDKKNSSKSPLYKVIRVHKRNMEEQQA